MFKELTPVTSASQAFGQAVVPCFTKVYPAAKFHSSPHSICSSPTAFSSAPEVSSLGSWLPQAPSFLCSSLFGKQLVWTVLGFTGSHSQSLVGAVLPAQLSTSWLILQASF